MRFHFYYLFKFFIFLGFLLCKYPMKFRLGTLVTYKELREGTCTLLTKLLSFLQSNNAHK